MGNTNNLNLHVISTGDNGTVSDFFQKIAGDGANSNFEIIDEAIGELKILLVGHDHTISEITDFPNVLPADGGNADTVGGKSADSFAVAEHDHDSTYYTEAELDNKLAEVNGAIENISTTYDPDGTVAKAGGIAAWFEANYDSAEEMSY